MNTTSASLLEQLRQPNAKQGWERFVKLYTPLLYHWSRDVGLPHAEAADLVQDVLMLLLQKLPGFAYDPGQSFRGWLRTVTLNKWREQRRKRAALKPAADAGGETQTTDPARVFEEREYRHYLVRRALQIMENEFQPSTWKACWECVAAGRPATEVAQELGLTTNAVYLAKSRVLRRLQQELAGLLD